MSWAFDDNKWIIFWLLFSIKNKQCGYLELSQLMQLWYLSHRRPAKAQVSLLIRTVLPEPLLFAHMMYGSRGRD